MSEAGEQTTRFFPTPLAIDRAGDDGWTTRYVVVEAPLVARWRAVVLAARPREDVGEETVTECALDGGGMSLIGEPWLFVERGGVRWASQVRHVDMLVDALRACIARPQLGVNAVDDFPQHVMLKTFRYSVMLTTEVASALIDGFESEATRNRALIDEWWAIYERGRRDLADVVRSPTRHEMVERQARLAEGR